MAPDGAGASTLMVQVEKTWQGGPLSTIFGQAYRTSRHTKADEQLYAEGLNRSKDLATQG